MIVYMLLLFVFQSNKIHVFSHRIYTDMTQMRTLDRTKCQNMCLSGDCDAILDIHRLANLITFAIVVLFV